MKKISIIVPCYNEEKNISNFLQEARKILVDGYEYEYIFIDDGSKDNTVRKIKSLAKEDSNVKLISFSRNYGKDTALRAGLDYCSGCAAITVDADLQMPLEYINEMLVLWEQGNKLVTTTKYRKTEGIKSGGANLFYKIYNRLAKHELNENALDFQLMDRKVVDAIKEHNEGKVFFKGLTASLGFTSTNIEIQIAARVEGQSKFGGFKQLFSYASYSLITDTTFFLNLGIYIGVLGAFGSLIYGIFIAVDTLIVGNPVSGWASLMVAVLMMGSLILIVLGIIGLYIGRIYEEVKKRPVYIIEEKINF